MQVIIVLVTLFGSLCAEEPTARKNLISQELAMLEEIIASTQETLKTEIRLRELIQQYQTLQEKVLKDEDNYELLYQLAKKGSETLELIKANHMLHTFDPAFISELNIVSKPAMKRGIPKS